MSRSGRWTQKEREGGREGGRERRTYLVEVGVGHQNERLDADEHLQQSGLGRIPAGAGPCPEEGEADFPALCKGGRGGGRERGRGV